MVDVATWLLERKTALQIAVAEVLEESAVRIDRDGFAQSEFWDAETGLYCTRGMFTQVVFERYMGQSDAADLWKAIIDRCDLVLMDRLQQPVTTWNDASGRTKAEVVTMLRTTATELLRGLSHE